MNRLSTRFFFSLFFIPFLSGFLTGCTTGYAPGPDKQFSESVRNAATGAGAGAVTGFQLGSGAGPGALVGAGFGAVAGAFQGAARDQQEERLRAFAIKTRQERARSVSQEILADHYARRLEIHPARDIFPADLFFKADSYVLSPQGRELTRELAALNKSRTAWSRLIVASYVRSADELSEWGRKLSERRAKALFNQLVQYGIEPRRIEARAILVDAPLVIDPHDDPLRYNQAIEFIAADK